MRKYNLSKIMSRAWELVKKAGETISSGLKKAWKEAKGMKELKGTPKQVKWAQDIINAAYQNIDGEIALYKKIIASCDSETRPEGKTEIEVRVEVFTEMRKMLDEALALSDSAALIIDRRDVFSWNRIERIALAEVNKRMHA